LVSDEFRCVAAVADVMERCALEWWIAGGWAIDLHLGQVTREHSDIEIGLFRRDQHTLRRHLVDWKLSRCSDSTWREWDGLTPIEKPDFQLKAEHPTLDPREFDLFLDDDDDEGGRWICRRHPSIVIPRDGFTFEIDINGRKIRALRPEIQLFYKAKYHRPNDEADFAITLPSLSGSQRNWLRGNLSDCYGADPWITRLNDPSLSG
jgi:hypothetical protein